MLPASTTCQNVTCEWERARECISNLFSWGYFARGTSLFRGIWSVSDVCQEQAAPQNIRNNLVILIRIHKVYSPPYTYIKSISIKYINIIFLVIITNFPNCPLHFYNIVPVTQWQLPRWNTSRADYSMRSAKGESEPQFKCFCSVFMQQFSYKTTSRSVNLLPSPPTRNSHVYNFYV